MPKNNKPVRMTTTNPYNVPNWTPVRYKIPIPEHAATEDIMCIRLSRWWRGVLLGMLRIMEYNDQWEGTEEQQKWAVQQIRQMIVDIQTEADCMELRFRNKPTNPCIIQSSQDGGVTWDDGWDMSACAVPTQVRIYRYNTTTYVYEVSTDGGQTWQDATSEDPRYNDPQTPAPSEPDAACKAANNFVGSLDEWITIFIDTLENLGSLTAVLAAIAAIVASILSGGAAVPLAIALGSALVAMGGTGLANQYTDEFREWLVCQCYAEFSLLDLSESNWMTGLAVDNIIQRLRARGDAISGIVEAMLNVTGPAGLANAAAMPHDIILDCDECGTWSHMFLAGAGEIEGASVVLGSYNVTDDWYQDVKEPAETRMSVQVNSIFGEEITITRVVAKIVLNVNNPFTPRNNTIYYQDDLGSNHILVQQGITNSGTYVLDTGQIVQPCHGLVFEFFGRHISNPADFLHFTEVTIYGEGTDPYAP